MVRLFLISIIRRETSAGNKNQGKGDGKIIKSGHRFKKAVDKITKDYWCATKYYAQIIGIYDISCFPYRNKMLKKYEIESYHKKGA